MDEILRYHDFVIFEEFFLQKKRFEEEAEDFQSFSWTFCEAFFPYFLIK